MSHCYVHRAIAPVALLLLGLTCAAQSAKPEPSSVAQAAKPALQGKDVFFAHDAVLNSVVGGDGVVGFEKASDVDKKTNPSSPSVRFVAGNSLSGTLLVLNSSRVMISGLKVGQNLVVFNNGTVSFSGGSVGGSVLANDNSRIDVGGGSMGGLFASDHSTVNMSGGSVVNGLVVEKHGALNVSGGKVGKKAIVNDSGTMNLRGINLSKTLTEAEASLDGGNISYSLYTLSGKLRDGTSVNGKLVLVQNKSGAKLILNNAH